MKDLVKDERFARISTDPRFRTVPKAQQKVKIDKRFKSMFSDERFKLRYTVDKRGRAIHTTTNESLRKYYDLSSESEEDESKEVSSSESDADQTDKFKLDLARGKGNVESSTSDDSSSEEESDDAVEIEHPWGEFDVDAPETQEVTKRLAVCNVDWDRIKAQDLFTLFNSFKPPGGVIHKVSIYPSEFGLQRMKEEQLWGPPELREADESKVNNAIDNEERDNDSENEDILSSAEDDSEDEKDDASDSEEADDVSEDEDLIDSAEDKNNSDASEDEKDNAIDNEETNNVSNVEDDIDSAEDENDNSDDTSGDEKSDAIDNEESDILSDEDSIDSAEDENDNSDVTSEDEAKTEEGNEVQTEKLRLYQLNRLKYFYGVVECDSPKTANTIYTECDGKEFEGSGVKFDLRFVPDDMKFEQKPKYEVTDLADPTAYKPANFISTALQQSKVECTWDKTDHDRLSITMRKFNEEEMKENDLRAYLASSSEDEESWPVASIFDKENKRQDQVEDDDSKSQSSDGLKQEEDILQKYKSLLKHIEEKEVNKYEKNMEFEVSWEPGLKDVTKDLVKKKEEKQNFTPWEEFLHKKKEKKKEKKLNKKQIEKSETTEEAISDDDLPSDVDLNDSFFNESFGPEFEKPKGNSKKKLKMVEKEETESDKKEKAELELLVMEDDGRQHFNLDELLVVDKTKSKRKRKRELMQKKEKKLILDNFKVNVGDSRFEALYTSHMFHIDPSNPQFKKTKGMEDIIKEKLRRVTSQNVDSVKHSDCTGTPPDQDSKLLKDPQLSLLVKSVKSAAQSLLGRKHR